MSQYGPGDRPPNTQRPPAPRRPARPPRPQQSAAAAENQRNVRTGHATAPRATRPVQAQVGNPNEGSGAQQQYNQQQAAKGRKIIQRIVHAARNAPANPQTASAAENQRSQATGHSVAPRPTARPARFFDPIFVPDSHAERGYRPPRGFGAHDSTDRQISHAVARLFSPHRTAQEQADAADDLKALGILPNDAKPAAGYTPGTKNPLAPHNQRGVTRFEGGVGTKGQTVNGKFVEAGKTPIHAILKGIDLAARDVIGGIQAVRHAANQAAAAQDITTAGVGFQRSAPPDIRKMVSDTIKKGAITSGGVVMQGLDRPVGAVEAGLVNKQGARDPLQVLEHGRRFGKDVSGADIAKELHLPRQMGLLFELGLDPTMYAGLALAPETGGASLAEVVARIERVAPAILHGEEAGHLIAEANQHAISITELTNQLALLGHVKEAAAIRGAHGLHNATELAKGLKGLTTPRRLREANAEASAGIAEKANREKVTINLEHTGGKTETIHIPGGVDDAIEHQIHLGEQRKVKPELRLNLMTPLGRRTRFGVNTKISLEKFPLGLVKDAPNRRRALTELADERDRLVKKLNKDASRLRGKHQMAAYQDKLSEIVDVKERYAASQHQVLDQFADEARRHETVGDLVDRRNLRAQAIHPARVLSTDYGRMVQTRFGKAIEDSLSDLPAGNRTFHAKRVQMFLNTWADTHGTGVHALEQSMGPMTDEERMAYNNLKSVHEAMGQHALQTGVLDRLLDHYVGMRQWTDGANTAELAYLEGGASKQGLTTGFQRHRNLSDVAGYASPAALRQDITELSSRDITPEEARDAAERLWHFGMTRTIGDITARQLARGASLHWEDLTPLERQHIHILATRGYDPNEERGLFRTPLTHGAETEGEVLPGDFAHYGIDMPENPDTPQEIMAGVADRQKVEAMMETASGQTLADLSKIHDRLTSSIAEVQAHASDDFRTRAQELVAKRDAEPESKLKPRHQIVEEHKDRLDAIKARGTVDEAAVRKAQGRLKRAKKPETQAKIRAEIKQLEKAGEPIPKPSEFQPPDNHLTPEELYHQDAAIRQLGLQAHDYETFDDKLVERNGLLWTRGRGEHNPHGKPYDGAEPSNNEAGPHQDPFDMYGHLANAGGVPVQREDTSDVMVELDPRVSGYARSRAQGITTAWNGRWRGFDNVYGRDADDPSLIRNTDRDDFIDRNTGERYARVHDVFDSGLMLHKVPPGRIWPVQALEQFKIDALKAGEMEKKGGEIVNANAPHVFESVYADGMKHGWERFFGIIRFEVTSPFPAYHIRNLISDLIKSLQADSGVLFHPIMNFHLSAAAFNKGLGRSINVPGMGKMKIEDFLLMADLFGVKTGHHAAEVASLVRGGKYNDPSALRRAVRTGLSPLRPGGITSRLGAEREDIVRYMTFMQRMRANGGDAGDAAWYMIRHHFNFNDISQHERRVVRNVFLFYTWYRKNIPLQFAELARRPGFFAGISHTYNELAAGETPFNYGPFDGAAPGQPALPDYVKDKLLAASVNWNGYALNVGFGAPYGDLNWASASGISDAVGTLLNPAIEETIIQKTRQDPLTGRTYKDEEPGGIAYMLDFIHKEITGEHMTRDKNGEPVLPWRLAVLLRQTPFLGRAAYSLGGTPPNRADIPLQKWGSRLSNVTGLNLYVSPKPGSADEKAALAKSISGAVSGARRDYEETLSNLPKAVIAKKLKEFDAQSKAAIIEKGMDPSVLKKIKGTGFYIPKHRGGAGGGLGAGSFGGGLGSGGLK